MTRDWKGDGTSVYVNLGSSSHSDADRAERDYYATDPKAVELLLERETFAKDIWEPASGEDHIASVLRRHGHSVRTSDIEKRLPDTEELDFLGMNVERWDGDIITNPPYIVAQEFVERAVATVTEGHKVAMFLRLLFLEGKARRRLFDICPPRTVYVASSRLKCFRNGRDDGNSSAVAYAWFVWEKGFKGKTTVEWIN